MENTKDFSNKKRLGRGIGSLLAGANVEEVTQTPDRQKQVLQNVAPSSHVGVPSARSNPTSLAVAQANTQTSAPTSNGQIGTIKKTEAVAIPTTAPVAQAQAQIPDDARIWKIAIDKIVPGIFQPRKKFEKEKIEELAQSIRENGLLQPITVRKRPGGGYEIVAGERRWRAAQMAGLHEVPALLKSYTDKETLQLAIIENVQRQDLDPIEEAEGYAQLIKEFGYSQQEVATKVGKDRATIANALRLMGLSTKVKDMISQGIISTGHAKVILSVEDVNTQEKLALSTQKKSLSVRALEQLVKKIKNGEAGYSADDQDEDPDTQKSAIDPKKDLRKSLAEELANQLQKKLGTKVNIQYSEGKGSLTLHFYTDDQLNQIYETICK